MSASDQPLQSKPAVPGKSGKLVAKAHFKTPTAVPLPRQASLGPANKPETWTPTKPKKAAAPPPTGLSAKKLPWSSKKKTAAPSSEKSPRPTRATATWALPKDAKSATGDAPPGEESIEATREAQRHEATSDRGPTAKQLVALLARKLSRRPDRPESVPLEAYKARPISFVPTRWDLVKMWASKHRLRLGLAGAGLGLVLAMAYLMKLISINADIDRQWHGVETALRQRYALAPEYLECIASYSEEERYTVALTEKALAQWHAARSETERVRAAARMERVLTLLAKVMKRYDQSGVAKDGDQAESSERFVFLEQQREQSRTLLSERVPTYNRTVDNFNDQVLGVPGMWIAWIAHLHERAPFYAGERSP